MIGGLMRAFGGFASKIAPRISRGIGQAVTASRHIGTAVRQARDMLCKKLALDEYEEAYTFLYRNLAFWGDDEDTQDAAIIIIKEGMVNHSWCADPEINLSATIVKLDRMRRGL